MQNQLRRWLVSAILILVILAGALFLSVPQSDATGTFTINGANYAVITDVTQLTYNTSPAGSGGFFWIEIVQKPPNGILTIDYNSSEFNFSGLFTVGFKEPTINGGWRVKFVLFHMQSSYETK